MKVQQFLDHHSIARNPFAEEDASADPVFKDFCIDTTFHPAWHKVYGDPAEPSTSMVLGEKGSGKTAMRLQISRHLATYNRANHDHRIYVIEYDDFNPFLDRFADRLSHRSRRRADKVLSQWRLWDHQDAILILGVTKLVDQVIGTHPDDDPLHGRITPKDVSRLDRNQARDLLLLAACYDQSTAETIKGRWHRLRKAMQFSSLAAQWDLGVGIASSIGVVAILIALAVNGAWNWVGWIPLWSVLLLAGWSHWLWRAAKSLKMAWGVVRHLRVGNRQTGPLRSILMNFSPAEITGQPLPNKDRTDDRYELLVKFQGILKTLGYSGIVVLVDRADEPHLINGSAELIRDFIWSMLDNKFLKHPGLGLKMLLPIEMIRFIEREDRDFYQRARLDKQNMVRSLEWTGEALSDVADARIKACAADGRSPRLVDLLDERMTRQRLLDALRSLRVPRALFKFLYRLMVAHCNAHTDEQPVWRISTEMFESVLAVYHRDQDAFDRGLGAG